MLILKSEAHVLHARYLSLTFGALWSPTYYQKWCLSTIMCPWNKNKQEYLGETSRQDLKSEGFGFSSDLCHIFPESFRFLWTWVSLLKSGHLWVTEKIKCLPTSVWTLSILSRTALGKALSTSRAFLNAALWMVEAWCDVYPDALSRCHFSSPYLISRLHIPQ